MAGFKRPAARDGSGSNRRCSTCPSQSPTCCTWSRGARSGRRQASRTCGPCCWIRRAGLHSWGRSQVRLDVARFTCRSAHAGAATLGMAEVHGTSAGAVGGQCLVCQLARFCVPPATAGTSQTHTVASHATHTAAGIFVAADEAIACLGGRRSTRAWRAMAAGALMHQQLL